MKKQTKQGFTKLFDFIEAEDLNLYGFSQLYFLQEKPLSDELLDVFRCAGWLDQDLKPTEKLKNLASKVEKLFVKAKIKEEIEIPLDKVLEFDTLFPAIKIPTSGQYAHCSKRELTSAFKSFFKEFGNKYSWEVIFQATSNYVSEFEQKNWEYLRRSKYFVRREMRDKSAEYLLEEYAERVLNGEQVEVSFTFPEKIV